MLSTAEERPSLSTLPTELLIQICEILATSSSGVELHAQNTTRTTQTPRRPPPLEGFSKTCRRFREICRPYLFRNVIINLNENFDIESLKLASVDVEGILRYIRSLRIYSAIKTSLENPADTIFSPNSPPEVVFSFIRCMIQHIPCLTALAITINDVELNDIFANSKWHLIDDEEIKLSHLEELTVSEHSTWVISLGDNQPQIPIVEEGEELGDGAITATGLRRLRFLHPEEFGVPVLNGNELWEYRERTEGFLQEVMGLGLESGLANGIRELTIQRTLDVVDLEKLAAAFPELEEFEYWIDRPLTPTLHNLVTGPRLVFSSLFRHLSLGIAPLTPPYNHDVFADIRLLGKYCQNLRRVRVQGVVRAYIKWLPQTSEGRYQVMFWQAGDGTTVAEVPCYRMVT